jgi:hypothetical protein
MAGALEANALAAKEAVRAERTRILSTLLDRLPVLAVDAVEAMDAEIPAYADKNAQVHADIRDQVIMHYRTLLTALMEDRTVTAADIAFVRGAAMRRARAGLSVEDYLNAFRVGQQVMWKAMVACAGDGQTGHEAALTLAEPLMRYCDFASTQAAHAYVEMRQYAVAEAARESRDLLETLLAGQPPVRGPLLAAARAHDLQADAPMVVLTAITLGPGHDMDAPYVASAAIARACGHLGLHTRTLTVVRHGEVVAVPVLGRRAEAEGLRERVERARERLRADGIGLAVGISTVVTRLTDLPRAYREARAATDFVPEDGGVAALSGLSSFEYLALRADDTAHHLVDPRIRTLLEADGARGGVLTATIKAFAAADLNLRMAAERLQIHHNTAQYRLRRIEQRTGRNPRRIADLLDLLIAIELRDAGARAAAPRDANPDPAPRNAGRDASASIRPC